MKNIKKLSFVVIAILVLVGGFGRYQIALAVNGEGTANIDGGAAGGNVTVAQSTSHKFTVVLTVGDSGIAANAENPTFTIPAGFTAPDAAPVANAGLVVADGDWFVAGGATCVIDSPSVGLTAAVGQVITVDVTSACTVGLGGTITLTYQGQSAAVMGAAALNIGVNAVISYAPVIPISAPPTITVADTSATLRVLKHVVNDNGGLLDASDFTMNVTGTDVSDSSFPGAEEPGTTVTLTAGSYSVDEDLVSGYTKSLGANCSGEILAGETKICTITNNDISGAGDNDGDDDGGEDEDDNEDVAIKVTKKASLSSFSGLGSVTYTYKVTNEGDVALSHISVKDDKCSPVKYVSGDSNHNSKLGVKEVWKYNCTKIVSKTETNRATASGKINGLKVHDHAKATVVVSSIPSFPNTGIGPDDKSSVPWNIIISIGIFITSFLFYSYLARKKLAI